MAVKLKKQNKTKHLNQENKADGGYQGLGSEGIREIVKGINLQPADLMHSIEIIVNNTVL